MSSFSVERKSPKSVASFVNISCHDDSSIKTNQCNSFVFNLLMLLPKQVGWFFRRRAKQLLLATDENVLGEVA